MSRRESASEIRERLLRETRAVLGGEAAQALEQQLREMPDIKVSRDELTIATVVVEAEVLPGDHWSLPFILGIVKQPEYRELIRRVSDPAAMLRANFISGAGSLRRRLNALILINRLLILGAIACLAAGLLLRHMIAIGAGVILWIIWQCLLSNLQTLTNIEFAARLDLYDAEVQKAGRPIILEIAAG